MHQRRGHTRSSLQGRSRHLRCRMVCATLCCVDLLRRPCLCCLSAISELACDLVSTKRSPSEQEKQPMKLHESARCQFSRCVVHLAVGLLGLCVARPVLALPGGPVEIFVDVPAGLASFTGSVPVTFGIPFEDGEFTPSDIMTMIDGGGSPIPAQFDVTSSWPSGDVRWILVDILVEIINGAVGQYFFCTGCPPPPVYAPMNVAASATEISVATGGQSFVINEANGAMGHFILNSTNGAESKAFIAGQNGNYTLSLETHGPIRSVAKMTGEYTASDASMRGQFITRVRAYAGLPYVRVYHTMIWDEDDTPTIDRLSYMPTDVPSNGMASIGIDDSAVGPASSMAYRQHDWDAVRDASESSAGTHLDGWIQVEDVNDALFGAVRWPWQQHPLGLSFTSGGLAVDLIRPEVVMSLAANDVAVPDLVDYANANWDLTTNSGPYTSLSPRGVGKTYEILIWRDDDTTPQDVKNTLLQHPVYAYPDPAYATRADLPTPVSPVDAVGFVTVEAAIENSFDWLTRSNAEYGDYGVWNYGDVQYDWSPLYSSGTIHFRKDRYWMNSGKGFSSLPWLLYLRSGARKYLEFAEAHARHVMDVDTCHVTNESELKFRGGMSVYSPLHFGAHTYPIHFATESAYLVSYYHMTGYERASDVLGERVDAVKTSNASSVISDIGDMLAFLATDYDYAAPNTTADNETVVTREHYASLGDIAVLYEATQDPTLESYANSLIDFFLAAQASNGFVPGTKTNNWFGRSMDHAQRAFPARRTELRDYLQAWWKSVGSYKALSTTGESAADVMSLWSMLIVSEHASDPSLRDLAVEYSRTGALGVYDDTGDWLGYSSIPRHELGTLVEDWVAAIDAASDAGPSNVSQGYVSMNSFNAGLVTETQDGSSWTGRHVFYVLEEIDQNFTVNISFNQHNAGSINEGRIRIIAPDLSEILVDRTIETRPGGGVLSYLNYPSFPQPYTIEGISNYQGSFEIEIPSDGQTGAYAIEVLNGFGQAYLQLPVHAESSTGKLVHYIPQYSRRAEFIAPWDLYYEYKQQLPSMSNRYGWGGQAFFRPESTQTSVEFAFGRALHVGTAFPTSPTSPGADVYPVLHREVPRIVGLDPSGSTVCASSITGTSTEGFDNPVATSCSFMPNSLGLHSVVLLNKDWHMRFFLDGVDPWWSAEASNWFDPTVYPHPEPEQFLVALPEPGTALQLCVGIPVLILLARRRQELVFTSADRSARNG